MTRNFTPSDLIAYVYAEASPAQSAATEAALAADPVLREEHDELTMAKEALPRVKFNAPKKLLDRVLGYSEKSHCALC